MEFPIDIIESIPGAMKTVTQSADIIKWIINKYQERKDSHQSNEPQDDERMDECFLKTLYALRQESESKKLAYIKCFAQNTILDETSDVDTDAILSFLMDIEQMTWRQFCFIEGFKRKSHNQIEIIGMDTSDINGKSRFSEIEKLVNLNYLSTGRDGKFYFSSNLLRTDKIGIKLMGFEFAMLMDFDLIPIDEIAKAFGPGMIKDTITY